MLRATRVEEGGVGEGRVVEKVYDRVYTLPHNIVVRKRRYRFWSFAPRLALHVSHSIFATHCIYQSQQIVGAGQKVAHVS